MNFSGDSAFMVHDPSAEFPFWVIRRRNFIEIAPAELQPVNGPGSRKEWVLCGEGIQVPIDVAEALGKALSDCVKYDVFFIKEK